MGSVLGPQIHDLPADLKLELLCPSLQKLRPEYFKNLQFLGLELLNMYSNEDLGTQGVVVAEKVLDQFAANKNIASLLISPHQSSQQSPAPVNLLTATVGAVHAHLGAQKSREMVYARFLKGHSGLSWLYLQALGS